MRLIIIICCLCILIFFLVRPIYARRNEKHPQKGWNIVPLPNISYNSDLGFQYGAFCDFYHFGNGSQYPAYLHKISIEASRFTKGSGVYRLFYDSKYLLPRTRITVDLSYLPSKMMSFYGFNGYRSPYHSTRNKPFYNINRDMIRLLAGFQHLISGKWSWAVGMGYYHYRISEVKLKRYRNTTSLYTLYKQHHIISPDEARGGNILQLKAGIVYDSRDTENDPSQGIWGETMFSYSPDCIDRKGYNHLKFTTIIRHYIPIFRQQLTFAYRLGYQSTIAGRTPFYIQSNINTSYLQQTYSEGLGGIGSLRGILRNRIVGNGIGWLNAELRFRFMYFRLLHQNWYFVINPLFDAGMVVHTYRKSLLKQSRQPELYNNAKEKPHLSAGLGIKAVMNHNFVLSLEWGQAFDKRDGKNSLNLHMNFLF